MKPLDHIGTMGSFELVLSFPAYITRSDNMSHDSTTPDAMTLDPGSSTRSDAPPALTAPSLCPRTQQPHRDYCLHTQ
jgi:hypothetical protein